MLRNLPGQMVEVINPDLGKRSDDPDGCDTFVFKTHELVGISSALAERLEEEHANKKLKVISQSKTFPYRTLKGDACFHCEDLVRVIDDAEGFCQFCPGLRVDSLKAPQLLRHNGVKRHSRCIIKSNS
ncbi:hypothetical protein AAF712_016768, partial [Marasmius tenuissimus]